MNRIVTVEEKNGYFIPYLNEHDKANRSHYRVGAAMKKKATEFVASFCDDIELFNEPFTVHFTWGVNSKHDLDNIAFAKKYVLDGLKLGGVIPDDNPKHLKGFSDSFVRANRKFVSIFIKRYDDIIEE